MSSKHSYLALAALAATLFSSGLGLAQQQPSQSQQSKEQTVNFDPTLESIRAGLRADKVALITQIMNLSPADSDKFWPVFRKYQSDVTNLTDERIKILRDYEAQYDALSNEQAKSLVDRSFKWEMQRTELRKKYFNEFLKATSAITAAKFIQVDRQLDLLLDIQIAQNMPELFLRELEGSKPAPAAK